MKKIIFISAGRSDFDRLKNILSELGKSKKIILYVFLTTEYYNKFFKYDFNKIKKKFNVLSNKKKSKHLEDTPFQMIKNLSEDLTSLSKHVRKLNPDLILIAGDRYEMLLGPLVAIPNNIPTFHFFGGSVTEGAIDELIRHGLTKMSHFHYTILKKYKERVLQLGEENWRVKNIGMPNLKSKIKIIFKSRKFLSNELKFDLSEPFMLLTYHPVTLDLKNTKKHLKLLVKAIKYCGINAIITYPNSDPKYKEIIKTFKRALTNKKKFLI
jgi:GDP/UDP-N,N'-diacetylbacillosamine 2-epimerase (hydrolysing)